MKKMLPLVLAAATMRGAEPRIPNLAELKRMIARFAPTELRVDASALPAGDRKALVKLIQASHVVNDLFLTQLWSENHALLERLEKDKSPLGDARLHYFWINKGPWSDLDEHTAFLPGVPPKKLPGANFYPPDMTKQEFEAWVKTLPESGRREAEGFFSVIVRDAGRRLAAVPYSKAYQTDLERAAKLLREAAAATENDSLKKFLTLRAYAFLSNDYFASDVAWMDLDAPLDVTIGPYETYNDELFGYKAAFEAYVNLRDEQESAKVKFFANHMQEIENNLPLDARYRNAKIGAAAPIRVVNEIFSAGDGNHGVQTAAYNLPNDERVVEQKGSKRVMLKNVQEAKFNKTLIPISRVVLAPTNSADLSFDSFFTHILAHELMHGLGPHNITVAGEQTTVRKQLKELYSPIEEAKADITGLWALQFLIDKGVVSKQMVSSLYTTFLASMFRSVRFGITEAHGRGVALQFNYLSDQDAIRFDEPTGTFSVEPSKIKEAVRALTHDILTLQAEGSYEKAEDMLNKYAVIRPAMKRALDRLSEVPVDIEPIFPLAK
jgi:hypothetical protein